MSEADPAHDSAAARAAAEAAAADATAASASDAAASAPAASIIARCEALGFALAGIAAAQPSERADEYRAWIAAGKHGEMSYLADDLDERLDPGKLVPGARSVICVADRYATGKPDRREPGTGRIARYARGEDYHVVVRARLESLAEELRATHKGHRFRVCVDTAPLLEREFAARAGIGSIGKNTLLIGAGGTGSWLLLGAIVTTLDLAATAATAATPAAPATTAQADPAQSHAPPSHTDPCGSCTRCIDACPTQAISPWSVDARRCISYLTIEHAGAIDSAFGPLMQDWVFGCDICQEVCPHNHPTRRSKALSVHPAYAPYVDRFELLTVLGWTDADWQRARLHGALRRASREMWVRNAALAAANVAR